MEPTEIENYSEERAQELLKILAPGGELVSITVPDGSFSNFTHVVEARFPKGNVDKFVVRRYKIFGNYDRGEKARREFKTFELLYRHQVPVPEPLLLDKSGEILSSPGIVTRFVEGGLRLDNISDPLDWAGKLAKTLAKIHSIPCGEEEESFLLQGNAEASWFINAGHPPLYMQEYPGGSEVWHIVRDTFPNIQQVSPVLLHIDYWPGNILWSRDEISAVVDWEEAAYGDPAVDVGYALMNIVMMGLPQAADEFLRVYEEDTGGALKNLGFWELAAAVRPMTNAEDWKIDRSPGRDIFQDFIEQAKHKI